MKTNKIIMSCSLSFVLIFFGCTQDPDPVFLRTPVITDFDVNTTYNHDQAEEKEVYMDEIDGNYGYGEDQYGNEVDVHIDQWDGSSGYGEDQYGNEVYIYQ